MATALRKLDGHIHLLGDGSSGSGCQILMNTPFRWLQSRVLLRAIGLDTGLLRGGLDEAYVGLLLREVRASALDGMVLLAQDWPHDEAGHALKERAAFYVPNHYLLNLAAKHSEIVPAVSIHPARADAMDELERCIAGGARALKLLPNVHNVNCCNPAYQSFWKRVAQAGMVFIAHTGGEQSLPVLRPEYSNPEILRLPLECGVKVIAAHCAGSGSFWEPSYMSNWLKMLSTYPNLYGDNSALASLNRAHGIKYLLAPDVQARIVHGSDYPIPTSALAARLWGAISQKDYRWIHRIENTLERDVQIKRACGFASETFARFDALLQGR
ncbi:MAG: amidohydrolase family protein [Verrucomicrobiota bacterium]|nr:amidohydrolase family protein [Verrucomicrobiota bacterium]